MASRCFPFSFGFTRRRPKPKDAFPRKVTIESPPPVYSEREHLTPSSIENAFKNYDDDLRDISLKIHSYHELAFKEFKSAKLITEFMEKEGWNVKRGIAGHETAFECAFSQGQGPVVSYNAVCAVFLQR
jgi:hypothetical protein